MPLRVALIGCGSMGVNHARTIANGPDTRLEKVIDPSSANGRAVADQYGARWMPEVETLDDVDAVVVAAPTEHHYAPAMAAIEAGKPLLVEKPVCDSLAQTMEIVEASRQAGTPLMCGLLERFNPAVMVAMNMLESPRYVRAERHSPYAPRIKTGVAWDLLVHDVDLVVRASGLGHPEEVDVEIGHFHPSSLQGAEDVIETTMRFVGGGIASASASRIGQRKVRRMVIHELDKMIEVDLLRRDVTAYRHTTIEGDVGHSGFRQATEMEVPEIIGAEPLASQLSHFVRLVAGQVDADVERGSILPAHRIVDQARSSLAQE